MYLTRLKTMLVEASKAVFDDEYPVAEFRNLHASIEYPVDEQNYPGLWIDFDPSELHIAGVDHKEFTPDDDGVYYGQHTRWMYSGMASFTVACLTSFERDRLYDELVRVFAFGMEDERTAEFRTYIESNEFIACNFNFDEVITNGFGASPGTPWGTEDMIYEVTVQMQCFGEFTSDTHGVLVPLSAIVTYPRSNIEEDTTSAGGWM